MTKVVIDPGVCGFTATVEVAKLSSQKVNVTVHSDCDMVSKMGEQLRELDWTITWKQHNSLFYKSVLQCIQHIACPVPVAILKAIEVEVGIALPKDITIHFETLS